MSAYNAATYRQKFMSLALGRSLSYRAEGDGGLNDAEFFTYLNNALNKIQQSFKVYEHRDKQTLTSGTTQYTVPIGPLYRDVTEITFRKSTGTEHPLTYIPHTEFRHCYDLEDTTEDSGSPCHWTWDISDPGKVLIRPVPEETVSSGLIYHYTRDPGEMFRIYTSISDQTSASVSHDATAVTMSQDPNTVTGSGTIIQYDAIGFIRTTNVDGTTIQASEINGVNVTDTIPMTWYRIDTISGTSITLGSALQERGFTSADFITAQVSKLEEMVVGGMRWAPVYLALAEYFEGRGQFDKADRFEAKGMDEMNEVSWREPDQLIDWKNGSRNLLSWR